MKILMNRTKLNWFYSRVGSQPGYGIVATCAMGLPLLIPNVMFYCGMWVLIGFWRFKYVKFASNRGFRSWPFELACWAAVTISVPIALAIDLPNGLFAILLTQAIAIVVVRCQNRTRTAFSSGQEAVDVFFVPQEFLLGLLVAIALMA